MSTCAKPPVSHLRMHRSNPHSKEFSQERFLAEKLAQVQSVRGLKSLLARNHANILKLGVHPFYFNSNDLREFNGIVKANGWDNNILPKPIISPKKLSAYEDAVAALFTSKSDFDNAFFVIEIPGRRMEVKTSFEQHGGIFVPKKGRIIYSPNGKLAGADITGQASLSSLADSLRDPSLRVVFVFGLYLSQCVHNGVVSVRKMLSDIGRHDVRIAISHLVSKEGKELV